MIAVYISVIILLIGNLLIYFIPLVAKLKGQNSRRRKLRDEIYQLMMNNAIDKKIVNEFTSGLRTINNREFIDIKILNTKPMLEYVFNSNVPIVIGRDQNTNPSIAIMDEEVSRKQCVIFFQNGKVYLQDESNTNSTIIKMGFKKYYMSPGEVIELRKNDVVCIRTVKLAVNLVDSDAYIIN